MKKYILSILIISCTYNSYGQVPEDVLRYSYFPQSGSARNMAIGGAMGSLGGDISALYVNPAGLGMYKTREYVFSPGIIFNNNKATFRETNSTVKNSGFNIGTSGVVIGFNNRNSKWTNQAFSIGITQTANFNNIVSYKGTNDYSSLSEQFTEQLRNSGLSLDDGLNEPSFAYGTAPAIHTYLIDTFKNAEGGYNLKGLPEILIDNGIAIDQVKRTETKGGIYELAIGYAANMDDKLYLGGSLGIPIVNYERFTKYTETDPSGDANNNFGNFELNDYLTTRGFGVNAKLGLIFKPADQVRFGVTVHTPTFYSLTDRQTTDLTVNTEAFAGINTVSSTEFTGGEEGKTLYTATTPWKAIFSGSYVFREINDTRKQRAFITADIEYIGYGGSNFKPDGETVTSVDQKYYTELKEIIKEQYKGNFNFKLGGELKLNTIMFRLGGAYYSNPYRIKEFNSNIKQVSGGLGYRNHGMFIDLTYVHNIIQDVNVPYRLQQKDITYADIRNTRGNVILTLGFKF